MSVGKQFDREPWAKTSAGTTPSSLSGPRTIIGPLRYILSRRPAAS